MKYIINIKNFKFTLTLVSIILIIALSVVFYINRYDWTPVFQRIPELESNIVSEFKADLWCPYFLSIIIHPSKNPEYWKCVLRRDNRSDICDNEKEYISAQWVIEKKSNNSNAVVKRGKKVLEGSYNDRFDLTSFNAQADATYKVSLILNGPEPTIIHTNPHFKIEVDPLKSKDTYIVSSMVYFGAIVLGLVSIIVFFIESKLYRKISN